MVSWFKGDKVTKSAKVATPQAAAAKAKAPKPAPEVEVAAAEETEN